MLREMIATAGFSGIVILATALVLGDAPPEGKVPSQLRAAATSQPAEPAGPMPLPTSGRENNGARFPAAKYSVEQTPAVLQSGDLDGDGDLDMVVLSSTAASSSISLLLNRGDATFGSHAVYYAGDSPLVLSNYDSHDLDVLINNGDGTFAILDFDAGMYPYGVALGDLDDDQDLDLVVANSGSDNVAVLLNRTIRLCPYDLDASGFVDPFDSNAVMAQFGCAVGGGDPACDRADVDGDGFVGPFDSNAIMAHFGPCP